MPLELPRNVAEPSFCDSLINPSSRGDGPDVAATEGRLRLLFGRDHSVSTSSCLVLTEDGDAMVLTQFLSHLFLSLGSIKV